MRRVFGVVLLASVLALAPISRASGAPAAPAADGGTEAQFVSAINSIRTSQGLEPLQVYGELVSVARGWTDQMVANGDISHNPNLASSVSAPWVKLGENVGVGYSVQGLMDAFVASPSHYKNIVQPEFRWIGVGVTWLDDGRMMTTHLFMAMAGDDAAPAPPSEPDPEQAASEPDHAASSQAAPAGVADTPPAPPVVPPPPADPVRVRSILADLRHVTG